MEHGYTDVRLFSVFIFHEMLSPSVDDLSWILRGSRTLLPTRNANAPLNGVWSFGSRQDVRVRSLARIKEHSEEVSRYAKGDYGGISSGPCRSCQSVLVSSNSLPLLPPQIAHGLAGNEEAVLQAARHVATVALSQQNAFG